MKNFLPAIQTLFYVWCCLCSMQLLQAQVQIQSHVVPPYLNRIADYSSHPERMVVTLTNTSTSEVQVQLTARVTGDNGIAAWVKPGYRSPSPIVIQPGQTINLNGNDIAFLFDINKIEYTGISRTDMTRGFGLLEGNYTLCIRALQYNTMEPLSPDQPLGCTTFRIADLEPPRILSPFNEQVIDNKGVQALPITWSTPPGSSPFTQYKVKLVEIVAPRNPNDAIQTTTPLLETTVSSNMLLYGPNYPALIPGRQYAMVVQATDPAGKSNFRNRGLSEVSTFVYGESHKIDIELDDGEIKTLSGGGGLIPDCNCKVTLPGGPAAEGVVGTDAGRNEIKVGAYTMVVTKVHGDMSLTGEGVIALPMFGNAKLKVTFENVQVNAQRQMLQGRVNAGIESSASFLPNAGDILPSFSAAKASQLIEYFKNNPSNLLNNLKNTNLEFALPLGLSSGDNTIAITNIGFTADQAWFDAAAGVKAPELGGAIAFYGKGICFQEDANGFCGDGQLALAEELRISNMLSLLPKGANADEQPGTSIYFDKDGFKSLTLNAQVNVVGMEDEANQPLRGTIVVTQVQKWNDWIAEVWLPKFHIQGLAALKFELPQERKIYFDNSDLQNPPGLPRSFDIDGQAISSTSADTWKGFYLEEMDVELPTILKDLSKGGKNLTVKGRQLIIDANGFTGVISNSGQLLQMEHGSLGGWYASVDEVNVRIFQSAFKKSSLTGKLVLPASTDYKKASNQLVYHADLTSPSGNGGLQYKFTVENQSGLRPSFDAMVAEVELSTFNVVVSSGDAGGETYASASLSGNISIGGSLLDHTPLESIRKLDLAKVKFENLNFDTRKNKLVNNDIPFVLKGTGAGESGNSGIKRSVAGFSFQVDVGTLAIVPGAEGISFELPISGKVNLVDAGPLNAQASGEIALISGLKKNDNTGRISWTGIDAELRRLELGAGATMGALTVKGAILYYNDKENRDEGIVGALETTVAKIFSLNLRARFGTKQDAEGSFKYFDFSGLADLGQTGITFFPTPPLALYGFGGGIGYNMKIDAAMVSNDRLAQNTTVPQGTSFNNKLPTTGANNEVKSIENDALALLRYNPGMELIPERNSFTLTAKILFGLTSRNTLDAEAGFGITFNTATFGLKAVAIEAKARILTDVSKPLSERDASSTGIVTLGMIYDATTETFNAHITGDLGLPKAADPSLLHVRVHASMYAGPLGWNIKLGTPTSPSTIKILSLLEGTSYFEIGNCDIDDMPDIPDDIRRLAGAQVNKMIKQGVKDREIYRSSSGFITGAAVKIGDENEKHRFLMFYGKLFAKAGFDLSIKNNVVCANNGETGGPGGWYAKGQAYFGAAAEVGVTLNLFFVSGDFSIFEAGVGAMVELGLPRPFYAMGRVGGYFELFGSLRGNFSLGFEIGQKCEQYGLQGLGIELISELYPSGGEEVDESGNIVVPINTSMGVLFNTGIGGYLEVDEYTEDSVDPRKRYFLFDSECVTFKLNGQELDHSWMKTAAEINEHAEGVLRKSALFYTNDGYLNKNTTYNFEVKATLKENTKVQDRTKSISYYRNPGDYTLMPNVPANSETKTVEFRTDNGFENIPVSELAVTGPLHSNQAVLLKQNGLRNGEWFVATKKVLDIKNNFAFEGDVKLKARILKNGAEVMDTEVNMFTTDEPFQLAVDKTSFRHSIFTFRGPELDPLSNYDAYIYAVPVSTGINNNNTLDLKYTDVNLKADVELGYSINMRVASLSGAQIGGIVGKPMDEPILTAYSFRTSAFADMNEKIASTKLIYMEEDREQVVGNLTGLASSLAALNGVSSISIDQIVSINKQKAQAAKGGASSSTFPQGSSTTFQDIWSGGANATGISIVRSKTDNKQYLERIIKPDGDGLYVIQLGFFGFNWPMRWIMRGEPFSQSDLREFSSNEIFVVGSEEGASSGIGGSSMNIRLQPVHASGSKKPQHDDEYRFMIDNIYNPYIGAKFESFDLIEFLSTNTGIPSSKFRTVANTGADHAKGRDMGFQCSYEGGNGGGFDDSFNYAFGRRPVYEWRQQNAGINGALSLHQAVIGIGDPVLRRPIVVHGHYTGQISNCTLPGQPNHLGNPIQSWIDRIFDPNPWEQSSIFDRSSLSQPQVWEQIGSAATMFQGGKLSQPQMQQEVGKALGRMR